MPSEKEREKTMNSPTFFIFKKINTLPNTVESPAIRDKNNGNMLLFIINTRRIVIYLKFFNLV